MNFPKNTLFHYKFEKRGKKFIKCCYPMAIPPLGEKQSSRIDICTTKTYIYNYQNEDINENEITEIIELKKINGENIITIQYPWDDNIL
jgi:hypothetical protein